MFSTVNQTNVPAGLTAKVSYSSTAVTVTFASTVQPTDFFTNGNNDAKWDEAGNWSGGVPTATTVAVIDTAHLVNLLSGNPVLVNPARTTPTPPAA